MAKSSAMSKLIRASEIDPLSALQLDIVQSKQESVHGTDGFFHPSSISKFCKRSLVLPYLTDDDGNKVAEKIITPDARLEEVFEVGTFGHIRKQLRLVHANLCLQWKPLSKREEAYKKELYDEYWYEPASVMTELWNFAKEYYCIEVSMKDVAENVKGHCDSIILFKGGFWFWEFKTWNSFAWAKLNCAELPHRIQAITYMRYIKKKYGKKTFYGPDGEKYTMKDVKGCRFWYENKDTQITKQYTIASDKELERRVVKMLASAHKFLKANKLPKRVYHNKGSKPCRWCDWSHFCFGKGGKKYV